MVITGNSNTSQFVGIGESTPTARLHVKGSGNDNTTTSLLVQNSDGDDMMVLDDNKEVSFKGRSGFYNGVFIVENNHTKTQGNAIFGAFATPTARLQVKGSGSTSATTALLVQNSAGVEHLKVTDDGNVNIRQNLLVNHPSVSSRKLRLGWGSIYAEDNSSELSIGAVYSQLTAPRITLGGKTRSSGADAIQVQTLNGMYVAPTASAEDPSAQFHIKGSGATSATTALLVQNSAGTELLKVRDDGDVITTKFKLSEVDNALYPNSRGDLGSKFSTLNHFKNAYLQGYIHITQGTTSDSFSTYNASAKLQVDSTTQGFLPPRMTTTQRDAISTPASGLMVYNTTTNKAQCYNGTAWQDLF